MNFIISGIQGCGKGTQSQLLCDRYNLKHISTGDCLREHIRNKTELGIAYEKENEKGNLASDDVVFAIIKYETDNLGDHSGYILDGFPRNKTQAKWITEHLEIDYVVYIKADKQIAINRMLERGRADDTQEAIDRRISIFEEDTIPAIDSLTIDIMVDGNLPPETVFSHIIHEIEEVKFILDASKAANVIVNYAMIIFFSVFFAYVAFN